MLEPLHVLITGAAGQIAYSLIYMVGHGDVFGKNQPVILHLLDITPMMGVLQGVVMEIQDCAMPLVLSVIATSEVEAAFKDIDVAFMVGAMPRKEGMERKDLISANVKIFKEQGEALNKYAKKTVKVLVVANPANTNALICSKYAPSIPKENFSAMTRLDQNRASAEIARRLNVNVCHVKNVIIWGNHSSTQFPDVSHATVTFPNGDTPVTTALNDKKWLQNDFIGMIQKRGASVIVARKMSSAMSAAKAAADHMRDLWFGTTEGNWVSMGVFSDGSYGAPTDVMFSFPVYIKNQKWTIVKGLCIDEFSQEKLALTGKELTEEREEALMICND